jgi:hypothetical protein
VTVVTTVRNSAAAARHQPTSAPPPNPQRSARDPYRRSSQSPGLSRSAVCLSTVVIIPPKTSKRFVTLVNIPNSRRCVRRLLKRKSRSARAVATAEPNFDDDESIASQSIISIGTASYRSEPSIGSRSEVSSRHLGMVAMGHSVPNQIDVHVANALNSLRRPDSQPAWLIASLRDGEYDEPSCQVCGFTSVRSVDNRPAWMTRKRPPRTESPEVEVPPVDILDVNAARIRARARRAATNSSPELVYGDQESDDEDKLIKWACGTKPPQPEPRWWEETREHWYRGSNTKRDNQGKLVIHTPPHWADGKLFSASTSDPLSLPKEDWVRPPKYDFANSNDNDDFCKLEAEADLFIWQVSYRDADDYSLGIEAAEEFPALEEALRDAREVVGELKFELIPAANTKLRLAIKLAKSQSLANSDYETKPLSLRAATMAPPSRRKSPPHMSVDRGKAPTRQPCTLPVPAFEPLDEELDVKTDEVPLAQLSEEDPPDTQFSATESTEDEDCRLVSALLLTQGGPPNTMAERKPKDPEPFRHRRHKGPGYSPSQASQPTTARETRAPKRPSTEAPDDGTSEKRRSKRNHASSQCHDAASQPH